MVKSLGPRVSRRVGAEGVAGRGAGVQLVQPLGAPAGPLPPDPLRGKLADATGYPLLPLVCDGVAARHGVLLACY